MTSQVTPMNSAIRLPVACVKAAFAPFTGAGIVRMGKVGRFIFAPE
jgi:hypothetical protein